MLAPSGFGHSKIKDAGDLAGNEPTKNNPSDT
jgi:hypothetical protein